ncbi:MAG: helix-turn-helix domain-containing protein [Flavobacteriaceae bacterium]
MMIKKVALLFFLFATVITYSQESINSYIVEYNRLISKSPDSALAICNQLIAQKDKGKNAFGYAGKANFYTLESEFELAGAFFEKALSLLKEVHSLDEIEIKANIFCLKSLWYLEKHDVGKAINILHEAINLCSGKCSPKLEVRFHSILGRAYSLSREHFKALEMSNISLIKLVRIPDFNTNNDLQKEYVREHMKVAYRSLALYVTNKEKYSAYLDSTLYYTKQLQKYASLYKVTNYNGSIATLNADINYEKNYFKTSKKYYEEALDIYTKRNYKKRVDQILFRIAECHYELGNYNKAEEIFLKQINSATWVKYKLLKNEAYSYFYLFQINALRENSEKASYYGDLFDKKQAEYYETRNESNLRVNDIVHLEDKKKEIEVYVKEQEEQKKREKIYVSSLILLTILICLLAIYFFYSKRKSKINIGKLNQRIEQLQNDVSKETIAKTSSLSDEGALKLIKKLKALEKEELFQQPNYTLNMLAKRLHTNSSYLSKTVNEYMNVTFAEYSNRLRIDSIIRKINKQKSLQNYTIDALAQEAGYKSVNSFNTNFKKILKVTPSQYLKEIKK